MQQLTLPAEWQTLPKHTQEAILHLLNKAKMKHARDKGKKKRAFGHAKGKVHLAEDFNAPLEAFKEYQK